MSGRTEMSRQIVLSDIHGNRRALENMLETLRCEHLHADTYHCLGDVVGYYSDPIGVWNRLHEVLNEESILVAGNHDIAVGRYPEIDNLGLDVAVYYSTALHYALWHGPTITDEEREHFFAFANNPKSQCPKDRWEGGWRVVYVHGDLPLQPPDVGVDCDQYAAKAAYLRPSTATVDHIRITMRNALRLYPSKNTGKTILLVGHSHVPFIALLIRDAVQFAPIQYTTATHDAPWSMREYITVYFPDVSIDDVEAVLVNVGSVGQPRDGVCAPNGYMRAHATHLTFDHIHNDLQVRIVQSLYDDIDPPFLSLSEVFDATDEKNRHYSMLTNLLWMLYNQNNQLRALTQQTVDSWDGFNTVDAAHQHFLEHDYTDSSVQDLLNYVWWFEVRMNLIQRLTRRNDDTALRAFRLQYFPDKISLRE